MSERKPRCSAQRLVSIALPSVLRERSKSTQRRPQRSNSGLRGGIAVELVARYAPLMRSRLPRPDANNSIASAMREAPPRQRNDAIGVVGERDFLGRHLPDEPKKSEPH